MLKKVKINMKRIAIVSCDKWKNKIEEDKLLQNVLIQSGYSADIISWEDQYVNYDEYIALVLRSAWGYQNNYLEFKKWLNMIHQKKFLLLNNPELISNNIRKDKQFELLAKYEMPIIPTKFIYKLEDLFNDVKLDDIKAKVLKPIISGSGENTFLIDNSKSQNMDKIINSFKKIIKSEDNGIMLQPYIREVQNGEFACVYIDGVNTHNMMRYPGIFTNKKKPLYLSSIPENVKSLADRVSKIEEYSNYLYMRIDIVLHNSKPMIMEVELAEPDLLFKFIPDEKLKNESMNQFAKKLIRRIEK